MSCARVPVLAALVVLVACGGGEARTVVPGKSVVVTPVTVSVILIPS